MEEIEIPKYAKDDIVILFCDEKKLKFYGNLNINIEANLNKQTIITEINEEKFDKYFLRII